MKGRLLFVVNVDWFFVSHRLPIAVAAQKAGYEVHIAARMTDQAAALQGMGFHIHDLPIKRGAAGMVTLFTEFRALYKLVAQLKPDIAHLVTIKPVLIGGIVARLTRTRGVVAAVSGLGTVFVAEGHRARLRRWLVERLYKAALGHRNLRLVVQNRDDQALLEEMTGLPAEKFTLIHGSGVDIDQFCPQPTVGTRDNAIVMLAGRLLKDKGVVEFAEAAQLLKLDESLSPGTRFVLVGPVDPDNTSSVSADQLADWQRQGICEIWGPRTDMAATLRQADIVVLPSYREGMPKVLQEAAACAKPVVTTDVAGCRDVILPGVSGVLVAVRDPVSLARGIKSLLADAPLRSRMGEAGRKLAVECFQASAIAERHLELYEDVLAGNG
nr:glycosyltransferase family 4 protein [uncultured Gellertiella sp.]